MRHNDFPFRCLETANPHPFPLQEQASHFQTSYFFGKWQNRFLEMPNFQGWVLVDGQSHPLYACAFLSPTMRTLFIPNTMDFIFTFLPPWELPYVLFIVCFKTLYLKLIFYQCNLAQSSVFPVSYKQNVCVFPKVICWNPTPQWDSIKRWDPFELAKSWRRTQIRELLYPFHHVRKKREDSLLWTRK